MLALTASKGAAMMPNSILWTTPSRSTSHPTVFQTRAIEESIRAIQGVIRVDAYYFSAVHHRWEKVLHPSLPQEIEIVFSFVVPSVTFKGKQRGRCG